jgi:hypothetical protein
MWHFIATDITKIKTITITIHLYTQLNMKIAIAQLYTENFDDWANIPIENKQEYCNIHSYDLVTKRGTYNTKFEKRHPSWHSIPLILEILETTNVDWVFWSDIDALVMDYTIKLESFIKPEFDMIIPNQGQGEYCGIKTKDCLCCGHYFVKNTEWAKSLLKALWEWPKDEYHTYKHDSYWEQCGMNAFWKNNTLNFNKHVYIEPYNRKFNSFYYSDKNHEPVQFSEWGESWFSLKNKKDELQGSAYNDGDFIIHFAGEHCSPYRKELMEKYKGKVKWN